MRYRVAGFFAALLLTVGAVMAAAPPASGAVGSGPRTTAPCSEWVELPDVSQWQGNIDWRAVGATRPGAWVKTSEGPSWVDPKWRANEWGATTAGVLFGGYHFARPSLGDAIRESDHFVDSGGTDGTLPWMLDLEANDYGMSDAQLDQWTIDFMEHTHARSGKLGVIYRGAYFTGGHDGRLAAYGLVVPNYPAGYAPNPNPCLLSRPPVSNAWGARGWDAWQFTSSNSVTGISGSVDMSVVPPNVWAEWTGSGVAPVAQDPTNPVPAAPEQLTWGPGSRGPKVAQIQTIVGVPADGVYGPQTRAAVARWQRALGLSADGVWGPQTDAATASFFSALTSDRKRPVVKMGSRSQDVCDLQALLDDVGYDIDQDCTFGPATNHVVRDFQATHGLTVDGVVGSATWAELGQ